MSRRNRRRELYLGLVVVVVALFTLAYDYGMTAFEGRSRRRRRPPHRGSTTTS